MLHNRFLLMLITVLTLMFASADAMAMYHPTLGRFMQRDPLGTALASTALPTHQNTRSRSFIDRDPIISTQYSDGQNLYQYVRSSPLVYSDPTGNLAISPSLPLASDITLSGSRAFSAHNELKKNVLIKDYESHCSRLTVNLSLDADSRRGENFYEISGRQTHAGPWLTSSFNYRQSKSGCCCKHWKWAQWYKDARNPNWVLDSGGWYYRNERNNTLNESFSDNNFGDYPGATSRNDSASFWAQLICLEPDNAEDTVLAEIKWSFRLRRTHSGGRNMVIRNTHLYATVAAGVR